MAFQVILPEGLVDRRLHSRLVSEVRRIYARVFDAVEEQVAVEITEIPPGRFFTAGKPSRSSLVGGTVPPGTSRADRTRFLSDVTAMWCEVTGCAPHDVLVSASDAPA